MLRRSLFLTKGQSSSRNFSTVTESYDPKNVAVFNFPTQTVYLGENSIQSFAEKLKGKCKSPLIVCDQGIAKIGLAKSVHTELQKHFAKARVYSETTPDPSVDQVVGIAQYFFTDDHDAIIALGGGGPIDAAKAAVAVVSKIRESNWHSDNEKLRQYTNTGLRQDLTSPSGVPSWFAKNKPLLAAIPTTAGTGSDGGKSSVITGLDGRKFVVGHPLLMPDTVALVPQFTEGLPPLLSAATGIDALFHCLEAYTVPRDLMRTRDKMTDEQIESCEKYAVRGIRLVLNNLPAVVKNGSNLTARLNMQVAALFGAKAFAKGDLGSIHASAHAVGSLLHIHHGTCIARMAEPVLYVSQQKVSKQPNSRQLMEQSEDIQKIFSEAGYHGHLNQQVAQFIKTVGLPNGLYDLNLNTAQLAKLSELAAADGCQTNLIELNKQDYVQVMNEAVNADRIARVLSKQKL